MAEPILVFDIGGTKVACAVWLGGETLWGRSEIATQAAQGPAAVVERTAALGQQVAAQFAQARPGLAVQRAGVASAGQIDGASGVVTYATFHLPGWIGLPLGERLAAGLGLPVVVDNDVNCHALAEARLGAGRSYRNFVLAAVGTGVGGGVVIDGQVYRGRSGGAGEIGQLCIEPHDGRPCSGDLAGCLEVYAAASVMVQASGCASIQELAARYAPGEAAPPLTRQRAGGPPRPALVSGEDTAPPPQAAVEQAVADAARRLGQGLALVAYVLAPEAILIGGSAALLGPRYLAAVQAALNERVLVSHRNIPLLFAELGADSGLLGAGLLAAEQILL